MNTFRRILAAVALLAVLDSASARPTLEEGFRNPPNEAKPHLWWHWMNGNVTREGITADLESMAEVGIGGAQIFDAGCEIPPGPVEFDSPSWYEMFRHAASEANRLGIELCHANCSGWSSSGGPWITPDKAMKWLLEPGETPVLKGPCRFSGEVPKPYFFYNEYAGRHVGEYYEDVAVLAIPALKPLAGTTNVMRLSQWKFKVFLDRSNDCLRDTRIAAAGEAIDRERIVDLTDRFDPRTGRVDWEVPAGEWRILRIGFASNGQRNFPASKNGVGYEVDKLSEPSVRFHMEKYCEKLVKELGPYAGSHPYGLNNILVDSYEVKSQNWTGGFEKTFEKSRGYSLRPYLPLIAAGYVVGSVEESERFLEDFRRVIADEFAKNYCGGLARKCHELGLRLSVEPYGNCPADNLQYGMYCDIPTAECWSHGQHRNFDDGNARLAAHVAHAWGRRYVAMEAFTGEPTTGGRWTVTPFTIKSQGDLAYCGGVNRVVYHRFVHQPWKTPYLPGLTMGRWGMHYERSNTWWYEQKEWLKYQARCQWMLQEGSFHADVLYYYGEGAPNVRASVYYGLENPKDAPQYNDYDQCARETVLGAEVKDGRIVGPGGVSYAVLVLPPDDFMSLEMIRKIESLADAGAMIVGTIRPVRAPGLSKDSDEVRAIADRIWGSKVKTVSVEQALELAKTGWDCRCETPTVRWSWIHRTGADGSDWYFVAAQNPDTLAEMKFSFPETGRAPELWNPETGTIERALRTKIDWRGRRLVTLKNFPPDGSMFVVFRGKAERLPVEKDWRTVESVPVAGPWRLSFPAGWKAPASVTLPALCSWTDYPDAGVRYFSGTATYETKVAAPKAAPGERVLLDLGAVKHFAQVTVNGRAYPSMWRPPFILDVTDALARSLAAGDATISVRVTNLWPNRLIGDEIECADDCTWKRPTKEHPNVDPKGIAELPDWVKRGGKSPTGRLTFTTWKHWTADDEPLVSGLLGPVVLRRESPKSSAAPRIVCEGEADVRIADDVVTVSSTGAVSFVRITWPRQLPRGTRVLNDAWERSYGDLEWRTLGDRTIHSPWYFLAEHDGRVQGLGVETGPGAMCCWEVTAGATTLVLDLRAGGRPVRLGGRTLRACRIVRAESATGESSWDFGRRFCRMMCPKPKLPKSPVYGYNDWYCAYGSNTATNFLADAAYIMECAKGCSNPPYVVMDDGWQKNSPPVVHESGRGPWDAAGPNFGMDMKTFCGRIAALGAKPGLWYRPLRAWDELPDEQRLLANRDYLDPTVPAVKERIAEDMCRFRDWGFRLVKIDFLSYDLSQLWPCDPHPHADRYIQDDRAWRDSSRTTAEVMLEIYRTMKDAAGDDVVIIGCNALNHLAAGVFELQRTGNDTSGRDWSWTRDHGVNTLAMRSIQDGAFFKIDADCVGLAAEGAVPWRLNRQWMDLLGRSGTPFFVSWRRQLAGPEVRAALGEAFRFASEPHPTARAEDWMTSKTPVNWSVGTYDWTPRR